MCGPNLLEGFNPRLGNNAQSYSPPPLEDVANLRLDRYRLQFQARNLLLNVGQKQVDEGTLKHKQNIHKTAKCLFTRHSQHAVIKKSIEHEKAFYAGLVVCASVWSCPVCAAKIQERRRIEVAKGFDWAYENDKKIVMVTFTFPHYVWQKLNDLLAMQQDAYRRLRSGKAWTNKKQKIGYTGLIRSLELTIGSNGWHPHTHEAWIVDKDVDADELQAWLTERWLNCCNSAGIVVSNVDAFRKRAVDIVDNARSSAYLAKQDSSKNWGADRELVKGSSKVGKHPFSLLNKSYEGDKKASAQFLEYVFAMRGKPQLFWSKGLKNLVGVTELTDEILASQKEDKATDIAKLTARDWAAVMIAPRDARANLLDLAENGGKAAVMEYLRPLKRAFKIWEAKKAQEADEAKQKEINKRNSDRDFGYPVPSESNSYKELLNDLVVKLTVQSEIVLDNFISSRIIR
jgi:hypothetical protein